MIKVFACAALFVFSANLSETPDLGEIRQLYGTANSNEETCRELLKILDPYQTTENPVLLGYKGVAKMIMANHVFSPFSKLKYFNQGKELLEKAIDAEPQNVELRLLRFLAQSNVPGFLGYNKNLTSDKQYILNSISGLKNKELKDYVVEKLLCCGALEDWEKDLLAEKIPPNGKIISK